MEDNDDCINKKKKKKVSASRTTYIHVNKNSAHKFTIRKITVL